MTRAGRLRKAGYELGRRESQVGTTGKRPHWAEAWLPAGEFHSQHIWRRLRPLGNQQRRSGKSQQGLGSATWETQDPQNAEAGWQESQGMAQAGGEVTGNAAADDTQWVRPVQLPKEQGSVLLVHGSLRARGRQPFNVHEPS